MVFFDIILQKEKYEHIGKIIVRPYWNVMGELNLDRFDEIKSTRPTCTFAREWGFPGLFAAYMLICFILLLNLLIAVFRYFGCEFVSTVMVCALRIELRPQGLGLGFRPWGLDLGLDDDI